MNAPGTMTTSELQESFFPVATEREYLLSAVFGEIPAFADPKRAPLSDPRARPPDQEYERGVEEFRKELCFCCISSTGPEQSGPVAELIVEATPFPQAEKRKRLATALAPPKLRKPVLASPAPNNKRKGPVAGGTARISERTLTPPPKRRREKGRLARVPQTVPPQPNKRRRRTRLDVKPTRLLIKREPDLDRPQEDSQRPPQSSAGMSVGAVGAEDVSWDAVSLGRVFAQVFWKCPSNSAMLSALQKAFPAEPHTTESSAVQGSFSVSPLKAWPGLAQDMKLFYSTTGSIHPYGLTWENKIDVNWALCTAEFGSEPHDKANCPLQHGSDYELDLTEKLSYSQSVGQVDRQRLQGMPCSLLHWPDVPPRRSHDLRPTRSLKGVLCRGRVLKDDVPLYERTHSFGHTLPSTRRQAASSLMQSIELNMADLKLRGIQLSLDYNFIDIFKIFPGAESAPTTTHASTKEPRWPDLDFSHSTEGAVFSEVSDAVQVLEVALCMIEDSPLLNPVSTQNAQKYLSNKLAIYPHHRMLWQLYLALFLRDTSESQASKQHQSQLCSSMCGPWYRAAVMFAAVQPTALDKISILSSAIESLVSNEGTFSIPFHVAECCLDLALRILYIELSTVQDPFHHKASFCSEVMSAMNSSTRGYVVITRASVRRSWICDLLAVLEHHVEHRHLFSLALIHGCLFGKLPSSIIHGFGFPKQLPLIDWSQKVLGSFQFEEVSLLLHWAMRAEDEKHFFTALNAPEVRSKQMLVMNVLIAIMSRPKHPCSSKLLSLFCDSQELSQFVSGSHSDYLNLAWFFDEKFKPVTSGAGKGGHGCILEQVVGYLIGTNLSAVVVNWSKMHHRSLSLQGRPVLLALARARLCASLAENQDLGPMLRVADELLKGEVPAFSNDVQNPSDQFFSCLSAFYSSVLKQGDVDFGGFLHEAQELVQEDPALQERLWMEVMTLAAAVLPRNDPRSAETVPRKRSFSAMKDYLTTRAEAFGSFLALLRAYIKEQIPSVVALDNVQTDLSQLPPRAKAALTPPSTCLISTLLQHLKLILPHFQQHETMRVVQMLCEAFPKSPVLVEFLIEILPLLPDYQRRCFRQILTILLHSIPVASFETWTRVIEISSLHGRVLKSSLESFVDAFYPGWSQRSS